MDTIRIELHDIKGTGPAALFRPLAWTGVFPLNNYLRESIYHHDLKELARLMEVRNSDIETPIRVHYAYGYDDMKGRWRTPLEYAIERGGLSCQEMVVFLLEKEARITQPAMVIALQVVGTIAQASGAGVNLPMLPECERLLKILSAAGAQWSDVMVGESTQAKQARRCLEFIAEQVGPTGLEMVGLPKPDEPSFTKPDEFLARLAEAHLEKTTAAVAAGSTRNNQRL